MKKALEIASRLSSVELGSIVAAAVAGAELGFGLLWVFVLGGVGLVLLGEAVRRFGSSTKRGGGPMRGRVVVPAVVVVLVALVVVAMEIAGIAVALELVTGATFRTWAPTAALAVWLACWSSRFRLFDVVVSILGWLGLAFVVAAVWLAPPWREVAGGLVPSLPSGTTVGLQRWGVLVIVALGASLSPLLFDFRAERDAASNGESGSSRAVRIAGAVMRTILVGAIVVLAAMVLAPRGKRVDDVSAFVDLLAAPFGRAGYFVFLAILGITCLRAAAQAASVASMLVVRLAGWDFGKPEELRETPRFALVYTVAIILAAIAPMSGVNPIELALIAMASTAALLPLAFVSFRALANAASAPAN